MNRKLINTILLSLAFVAIVIGIHRSIADADIARNYWIFMVALVFYVIYHYRKKKDSDRA